MWIRPLATIVASLKIYDRVNQFLWNFFGCLFTPLGSLLPKIITFGRFFLPGSLMGCFDKKNWMVCSSNGLLCWSRSIFKGLVFLRRRPLFIHIIKNQRKRDWIPYKKPSAKKVTPLKHINIKSSQITKEAPLNFINIKRSQIMWLAPLLTLQALKEVR